MLLDEKEVGNEKAKRIKSSNSTLTSLINDSFEFSQRTLFIRTDELLLVKYLREASSIKTVRI